MTVTFSTLTAHAKIPIAPTFEGMFFPAGEAHVKVINDHDDDTLIEVARVDGASGDDLMLVAMWADACLQRRTMAVLILPYLPGARQDRGIPFGAGVYAEVIRNLPINQIITFDPHSEVMPAELFWTAIKIIDHAPIVRQHVIGRADRDDKPQRYVGIICPDEGARERTERVAKAVHLPVYYARKKRNPDTGALSGFECDPLPDEGRLLIVDDICDGGGTFLGLAAATGLPPERLDLYVSHGVFSNGAIPKLFGAFGEIYTTDSYSSKGPLSANWAAFLHTIPLHNYLIGAINA